MLNDMDKTVLFCNYYRQWVEVYKRGAIREATMAKYMMTLKWVEKLVPELKLSELTRTAYQQLLNDYAKEHDMGLITYEQDTVITGTRKDEYMEFEARLNKMELKEVDNFSSYVDFDVNKCLFTADVEQAEKLEKELAKRYTGQLSVYRSEPFFIEVMPLGVDKAASLEQLFKRLGIEKEETVACGDGFNDISMIKYAGVGVAMANAQEKVKEIADVVTEKTNDEDGLLEVIERYFPA